MNASQDQLKVISWNIAGWTSKQNDPSFLEHLRDHNIIFIQETWFTKQIKLNGYAVYDMPAETTKRKGRPKAGLAIMISTALQAPVNWLSSCGKIAIAGQIVLGPKTLLLVNVYIPPFSSRKSTNRAWEDLENYIIGLECKFPKAQLLIMGDFNARLGSNNSTLFSSSLWGAIDNEIFAPSYDRMSKDTKVNYGGICMIQMVSRLGLIILNGNPHYDKCSEFTYVSGHGSSAVDFVLISHSLSREVLEISVGLRLDSDHLPLNTTVLLSQFVHLSAKPHLQDIFLSFKQKRIHWTEETHNKLEGFFGSAEGKSLKNSIIGATNATTAINNYSVLINVINMALTSKQLIPQASLKISGPKWFDRECYVVKKQLREV